MSEIKAPLLQDSESSRPTPLVLKDVLLEEDDKHHQENGQNEEGDQKKDDAQESKHKKEPPYSVCNEVKFFFNRGIPLALASLLEWGIPPWYLL